jgi:hypothetical protein
MASTRSAVRQRTDHADLGPSDATLDLLDLLRMGPAKEALLPPLPPLPPAGALYSWRWLLRSAPVVLLLLSGRSSAECVADGRRSSNPRAVGKTSGR